MLKPIINIYWFKRDLRLVDNVPLQMSCDEEHPTLLLYLFEPDFNTDAHHSCLLYTSPSPRDGLLSRMPSSA